MQNCRSKHMSWLKIQPAATAWVFLLAVTWASAAVEYGTWGLDTTTMDPSVKPGDDFYRYVLGKWLKSEQIPEDRAFTGNDLSIDNKLKPRLRAIVEDSAKAMAPLGTPQQKIGGFYSSYMNEAAVEARGLAPVKAELDAIDAIATRADLAAQIGLAMRHGIDTPVGGSVDIDAKNPERYLFRFSQSSLSFGERVYYLEHTPEFQKLRDEFRAHVARMLKLAGAANAESQAASAPSSMASRSNKSAGGEP
jgi:putative endopeptidase